MYKSQVFNTVQIYTMTLTNHQTNPVQFYTGYIHTDQNNHNLKHRRIITDSITAITERKKEIKVLITDDLKSP